MGALPSTNSKPDGPYSLLMPVTVCCSTDLPSSVPRSTTTMPMMGLPLASTTVPPMPAQLQASSGWITVLSTCWVVALNGALGVAVAVGGFKVRVGGTSEKGVLVKKGVKVGRGVLLGVRTSVGLAVQVGSIWRGVTVSVGGWLNPP